LSRDSPKQGSLLELVTAIEVIGAADFAGVGSKGRRPTGQHIVEMMSLEAARAVWPRLPASQKSGVQSRRGSLGKSRSPRQVFKLRRAAARR
jgi:hypothetical protein